MARGTIRRAVEGISHHFHAFLALLFTAVWAVAAFTGLDGWLGGILGLPEAEVPHVLGAAVLVPALLAVLFYEYRRPWEQVEVGESDLAPQLGHMLSVHPQRVVLRVLCAAMPDDSPADRLNEKVLADIVAPSVWDYTVVGRALSPVDNACLRAHLERTYFASDRPPDTSELILLDDYPLGRDSFVLIGTAEVAAGSRFARLEEIADRVRMELCLRYRTERPILGLGEGRTRFYLVDSDAAAQRVWERLRPSLFQANEVGVVAFDGAEATFQHRDGAGEASSWSKESVRDDDVARRAARGAERFEARFAPFFEKIQVPIEVMHELSVGELAQMFRSGPGSRIGAVAFVVGLILSPFTSWNDAFVNIPIAMALGWLLRQVVPIPPAAAVLAGYWLSNVIGLALMAVPLMRLKVRVGPLGIGGQLRRAGLNLLLMSGLALAVGYLVQAAIAASR